MQLTVSRTDSQLINATWLHNEQSHSLPQSLKEQSETVNRNSSFKIRSGILLKGSKFKLPIQDFVVSISPTKIQMRNQPEGNFPKIEFIASLNSPDVDIGIRLPDIKTVESQILYTRLLFAINESESIVLFNQNEKSLEIKTGQGFVINLKEIEYRAKLFRKLRFIEKVFKIEFDLPKEISANEIKQVEILFRGLTEGEFSIPAASSITIFNYKLTKGDLQNLANSQKEQFSFESDDGLLVLGKLFPTGKIIFKANKACIANAKPIKNFGEGENIPSLRLNIFDYQVHHVFEKYIDARRLLKNKQKLEQFKDSLRAEEPEFLANLLNEPLAEITYKNAVGIVEGLLQYYDFPDRFSVLKPSLQENQWQVSIALTYPKHEPIWLVDAFVDVKTGEVEMEISFDELLNKGKMKAKEVFSLE